MFFFFFFFNDTATTEIYTLSLHDALPISIAGRVRRPEYRGCAFVNAATEFPEEGSRARAVALAHKEEMRKRRSEEHTSELQSLAYLVCRLLLEKKKKKKKKNKKMITNTED